MNRNEISTKQNNLGDTMVYMNVWTAYIGEDSLFCIPETDNIVDPDAVAIQKDDMVNTPIVGHVPLNYAPIFKRFLSLPNHHIRCRVTGKRVNRGGGFGLEVPVDYIFLGDKKAIKWLASRISSIDKALDEQLKKCLK